MEGYGEHTQTHTFENHANYLLTWQTDHCSLRRMAIKHQGGSFLGFAEVSLCLLFEELPKRAPTKTQLATCTVDY